MQKRRFHSQNAGFEMSAPIGIGVKILAGRDVSPSNRDIDSVNINGGLVVLQLGGGVGKPWLAGMSVLATVPLARSAMYALKLGRHPGRRQATRHRAWRGYVQAICAYFHA
jgi:hypothetical protein